MVQTLRNCLASIYPILLTHLLHIVYPGVLRSIFSGPLDARLARAFHLSIAGWIAMKILDEALGDSTSLDWILFWRRFVSKRMYPLLHAARNTGTQIDSSPGFNPGRKKKTIVWIDGCWDMTHFGHFNAFRQAKALGDYLIVGMEWPRKQASLDLLPPEAIHARFSYTCRCYFSMCETTVSLVCPCA
jgi:cytidyltransferase-like protein